MMSKCGQCGGFSWELSEEAPTGSNYKVYFVRCTMCKVPIGVMDFYHTHTKLDKIDKSIIALGNLMTNTLQTIDENVRRLFRK